MGLRCFPLVGLALASDLPVIDSFSTLYQHLEKVTHEDLLVLNLPSALDACLIGLIEP